MTVYAKDCPFCGQPHEAREFRSLIGFGPDKEKLWGEPYVEVVLDCLDGQCFPLDLWQKRPIEDALREQVADLREALALYCPDHDWLDED